MATKVLTNNPDNFVDNNLSNTIFGRAGNDTIDGRGGNDTIYGEGGNDRLLGGSGTDTLSGGAGNDRLDGGDGNDRLVGGDGNDLLIGDFGNDRLEGGAGVDTLAGAAGDDLLFGGAGLDKFTFKVNGTSAAGHDKIADFDDGDKINVGSFLNAGDLDTNGDNFIDGADNWVNVSGSTTIIDVGAAAGFAPGNEVLTVTTTFSGPLIVSDFQFIA